jgi:DNA modification methylase
MRVINFDDGIAINGSFGDKKVSEKILETSGKLPLVIFDPPYGNIVKDKWDKVNTSAAVFADQMIEWANFIAELSQPNSSCYFFGGIGKTDFRPFYKFAATVEEKTDYKIADHITWVKKRGFGKKSGYLFVREEILWLVLGDPKKPKTFHIPLLDTIRPYKGYNAKYPALSDHYRRTNVWSQTEIMRGKIHECEKPSKIMEIPIEVHTNKGDWVLDPMAGSGSTAKAARKLNRKFIVVERDPEIFEKMISNIRGEK